MVGLKNAVSMYEEENSAYSNAYRQYSQDNVLEVRELQVERKFFASKSARMTAAAS